MAIELVSFDLDGTLVDTAPEIAEAVNGALADHGIAPRPQDEITRLIGGGVRELALKLLARIFLEEPPLVQRVSVDAVIATLDAHYAASAGRRARPYEGAPEALAQLREAGVRLACVTNKELRHARAVLRATGLEDCFDLVLGGDSLTQKKPHPSVLRHAVEALGGDTLTSAHVGDSAIDVEAARNAGVAAWAVPYGYNAGRPIESAAPERIFSNLRQLAAHVLARRREAAPIFLGT